MDLWEVREGDGPLIATAIHAGHALRPEIRRRIRLTDAQRLREEDAYTDAWVDIAPTSIVVHRSRFEVDVNRPRDGALYATPEQAWGLHLWDEPLPQPCVEASLQVYDAFYALLDDLLRRTVENFGRFVVYDLHSYNHRREGADAPPEDPEVNPEINLGTGTLDRRRWGHVAGRFITDLRAQEVGGHRLDVRENVRFRGGHMSEWTHENFPDSGCVLAIEVKKFFMDEHRGEVDPSAHKEVRDALAATVPGVLDALQRS